MNGGGRYHLVVRESRLVNGWLLRADQVFGGGCALY